MGRLRPDPIDSFEFANESISWISGYENEAAVDDASRQIVRYFGLEAFVCERELVERDGTSFTMVVPFKEPGAARALLAADPYYARVRGEVGRALIKFDRALRDSHGKAAP